jgi:hypothetical protein
MSYINIVGVKVPTDALKHEVNTLVLARLRANNGWDGNDVIKGLGPVTKEKLMKIKEQFRNKENEVSAVIKMSKYFGIRRPVPADLVKSSAIIKSMSEKNPILRLARLTVDTKISLERRKVFCEAVAQAAVQKCWGSKVTHHGNGSYVNLWWDGRVADK